MREDTAPQARNKRLRREANPEPEEEPKECTVEPLVNTHKGEGITATGSLPNIV